MKNQKSKIKNQKYNLKLKSIKSFAFFGQRPIVLWTILAFFTFNFALLTFNLSEAHGQISSIGIANYLEITSEKVEDGDIIVTSEKGYVLSYTEYDPRIIGVVTKNPAISLKTSGTNRGFPVVSSGTAVSKVTDSGGNINKGDFVTTSAIPGTGMKLTKSGFVLGEAIESATFTKKGEVKFITISINPHYVQSGLSAGNTLLDIFKLGNVAANEKPSAALKYIVATLIIIITFGSGFLIFAKSVNTGLEALGRNPLASKQIQLSIIFNIIMIIVIIVVGTGLAYIVIRL